MTKDKSTMSNTVDKELDKIDKQFESYSENIEKMTLDRMNAAPKMEQEPQTKLSQSDLAKSNDVYLKPNRSIGSREKFNENYRSEYEYSKEYVQFIAENKEIIGETIEMWTKPFAGLPAEMWKVPVNKAVWGPRYLAEQIKRCSYHRLVMQANSTTGSDYAGTYTGHIVADTMLQRLDASPVSSRKSVFMGKSNF